MFPPSGASPGSPWNHPLPRFQGPSSGDLSPATTCGVGFRADPAFLYAEECLVLSVSPWLAEAFNRDPAALWRDGDDGALLS